MYRIRNRTVIPAFLLFLLFIGIGISMTPRLYTTTEPSIDFPSFYFSAASIMQGTSPYDIENLQKLTETYVYPYIYSPILAQILTPLSSIPYQSAERLFILCNIIAVSAGWGILFSSVQQRKSIHPLIIFLVCTLFYLIFPFRYVFNNGQLDGMLFFASCCLFLPEKNKSMIPIMAALTSITSIIKHAFISLPVVVMCEYKKRGFFLIILSGFFCISMSIMVFGVHHWYDFLTFSTGISLQGNAVAIAPLTNSDNYSFAGVCSQWLPINDRIYFVIYGIIFFTVVLGGIFFSLSKLRLNKTDVFIVTTSLLLLFSPFLWKQHFLYICPAVFLSFFSCIQSRKYKKLSVIFIAILAMFVMPKIMEFTALQVYANIPPFIGLWSILMLGIGSIRYNSQS